MAGWSYSLGANMKTMRWLFYAMVILIHLLAFAFSVYFLMAANLDPDLTTFIFFVLASVAGVSAFHWLKPKPGTWDALSEGRYKKNIGSCQTCDTDYFEDPAGTSPAECDYCGGKLS